MNLKTLTDKELHKSAIEAASAEFKATAWLIENIREVERRKSYSDYGCQSLLKYCTKYLKLSDASAQRRIDVLKLSKDVPEVTQKIIKGEMSLSLASETQRFINRESHIVGPISQETKRDLVEKVEGKSVNEGKRELMTHSKQPDLHYQESKRPITPKLTEIRFAVTDEQLEILEQARGLTLEPTWADHFATSSKISIEKLDKAQRTFSPIVRKRDPNTRFPCPALEAEIWKRDKSRCKKCSSTYRLQIDHIIDWALGGETTEENLHLLCGNCHRRKTLKTFGHEKIAKESRPR